MHKKIIACFLGVMMLLMIIFYYRGFHHYLTIENLKAQKMVIDHYIMEHYPAAIITFMIGYIVIGLSAIPFVTFSTITGGFLFGTYMGTLLAASSATIAAAIFFLIMRSSLGRYVQKRYGHKLKRFNAHMARDGAFYFFALRLVAIIPFSVVNVMASIAPIPLITFIITTFLGVLPGDIIYAFAGAQLGSIQKISDIYSPSVVMVFVLLAFLGIVPLAVKSIYRHNIRVI